jgi:hypothetical protein
MPSSHVNGAYDNAQALPDGRDIAPRVISAVVRRGCKNKAAVPWRRRLQQERVACSIPSSYVTVAQYCEARTRVALFVRRGKACKIEAGGVAR